MTSRSAPTSSPATQITGGGTARVYTVAQSQAEASPTAVTGQILFHDLSVYALIDSGATHSFVSPGVIERVGLAPSKTAQPIRIELPDGDNVIANGILKGECLHSWVRIGCRFNCL